MIMSVDIEPRELRMAAEYDASAGYYDYKTSRRIVNAALLIAATSQSGTMSDAVTVAMETILPESLRPSIQIIQSAREALGLGLTSSPSMPSTSTGLLTIKSRLGLKSTLKFFSRQSSGS